MALGLLLIEFIGISAISILGFLFLILLKSERTKAILFYCLAVWGMALSAMNATSLPTNYTLERIIAWGFGFLSVIALILHIKSGSTAQRIAAYVLVAVSVAAAILKMFVL